MQTKLRMGGQKVGNRSEWPIHNTKSPSPDPGHPPKETCASKDRVLTMWLYGTFSTWNTCHHEGTVLLRQGDGVSRHHFVSQRYLFALLRTSEAKEAAWSSSHRHWCPGPGSPRPGSLPHHIDYEGVIQIIKLRGLDSRCKLASKRKGTLSPHLMNYRNKSLPSPLENYEYESEVFSFSRQNDQIHNRFTLQSPNNWSCIWEAHFLFYISKSVILWTMPFFLVLLPPSQRAGWEAGLPPPIPPQLD